VPRAEGTSRTGLKDHLAIVRQSLVPRKRPCTGRAARSSGDFPTPSPPAGKATARQDQAGQAGTGDGAGHSSGRKVPVSLLAVIAIDSGKPHADGLTNELARLMQLKDQLLFFGQPQAEGRYAFSSAAASFNRVSFSSSAPPSPPAEKTTACKDQTGQSSADDGTGNGLIS